MTVAGAPIFSQGTKVERLLYFVRKAKANDASDAKSVEARADRLMLPYRTDLRWCGAKGIRS